MVAAKSCLEIPTALTTLRNGQIVKDINLGMVTYENQQKRSS